MQSKLKEKDMKDIEKDLADARKRLFDFRISVAGGKIKDVKEGRNTRKEIARMLTELSARVHVAHGQARRTKNNA